ncbi:MAG: ATP-binding protein [Anaerohalosphaeraceae bacterium]
MARIAEVVKTIPVQYGQCDVVVSGEMSVQEVLTQVVSDGLETVGVSTDGNEMPALLNREQLLQAMVSEVESIQNTLSQLGGQLKENAGDQYDLIAASLSSGYAGAAQKFEQALKAMTEGMIIFDVHGRVEMANPSARSLLGLDGEADIETVSRLLDHLGFRALMTLSGTSRGQHSGQFRIKSAHARLLETRWSLLKNDWGQALGWVITMRDITSEIAADNTKSEFIAAISHELRTPLTSIQNSVSNILAGVTGKINDKTRHYLDVMKNDCHRFADLINDLLDVAKLEAGNLPITQRVISLESLVQNTVHEFMDMALAASVTLDCRIEPDICPVYADGKRLRQVLSNLLRNAIHFSPAGQTIHISVHDRGSDIVTEVSDAGEGICPEMQKQLFTKFYQIARQAGPGSKGNGLGLAICKGIIAVHGGSIWVESEEGKGSRFFFSLPKIDPARILKKHLDQIISSARMEQARFGFLLLSFEMSQKCDTPLRQAAGKIITDLLGRSRYFLSGELDLALQSGENQMVFIIGDFGRQSIESVQQKIELNLMNYIKKHFINVPIVPMLGKSLWPKDGTDKVSLETAARNNLAPLIAG